MVDREKDQETKKKIHTNQSNQIEKVIFGTHGILFA